MTDKPDEKPKPETQPVVQTELIPSQAGQVSGIGSMNAPIIYSDFIGTYGTNPDFTVANISLEAVRHMPVGDRSVADRVVVAHPRLPMGALRSLKDAIEKIELMTRPVPETEKN
jgi:hypothetical protein